MSAKSILPGLRIAQKDSTDQAVSQSEVREWVLPFVRQREIGPRFDNLADPEPSISRQDLVAAASQSLIVGTLEDQAESEVSGLRLHILEYLWF